MDRTFADGTESARDIFVNRGAMGRISSLFWLMTKLQMCQKMPTEGLGRRNGGH